MLCTKARGWSVCLSLCPLCLFYNTSYDYECNKETLKKDLVSGGQLFYLMFNIVFVCLLLVLHKGLTDNFADVQVSVVDCPDLTKEPFTFPVRGA